MPTFEGGEGTTLPKPHQKASVLRSRDMDARAATKTAWQSATVKQVHKTLKKYSNSPSTLALWVLTNKTIKTHLHPQERVKEPSVSHVPLSHWQRNACEILPAWPWG